MIDNNFDDWVVVYEIGNPTKFVLCYFDGSEDHTTWGPKTTFAHKFSMENEKLRFTFAELNNVYGKDPSLVDFSPTVIWHDNLPCGGGNFLSWN